MQPIDVHNALAQAIKLVDNPRAKWSPSSLKVARMLALRFLTKAVYRQEHGKPMPKDADIGAVDMTAIDRAAGKEGEVI